MEYRTEIWIIMIIIVSAQSAEFLSTVERYALMNSHTLKFHFHISMVASEIHLKWEKQNRFFSESNLKFIHFLLSSQSQSWPYHNKLLELSYFIEHFAIARFYMTYSCETKIEIKFIFRTQISEKTNSTCKYRNIYLYI